MRSISAWERRESGFRPLPKQSLMEMVDAVRKKGQREGWAALTLTQCLQELSTEERSQNGRYTNVEKSMHTNLALFSSTS